MSPSRSRAPSDSSNLYAANSTALRVDASAEKVHRGTTDERCHERIGRPVVQLAGAVHLLDDAVVEDCDAFAESHRLGLVMGHVERRHPEPLVQLDELRAHLYAQLRIEVRQRLVHQERSGVADDRTTHRHALALATREGAGLAIE